MPQVIAEAWYCPKAPRRTKPPVALTGSFEAECYLFPATRKNHVEELHEGHTQNHVHRKFQPSP
jgi:hypothetical protein